MGARQISCITRETSGGRTAGPGEYFPENKTPNKVKPDFFM